jgi:hypothetical protein
MSTNNSHRIQSIPSPKAEPFKMWLAEIARERLEEIDDPELDIERLMEYYHRKGYSEGWINQRLKSIEVRKELTDEWERRGVKKEQEFASLTDIITVAWAETSYCVQTPHQPSGRTSSVGWNLQLPEKFVGLVAAGWNGLIMLMEDCEGVSLAATNVSLDVPSNAFTKTTDIF